jgi:hypothetical protein
MIDYRKLWENYYGPIPKDDEGRTFEIHHKDGNRSNNQIENLRAVSISEHYKIHESQGDWFSCGLISKRMNLPPNHMSEIQKGKKRPGIGGAKKGRVPWNKGKKWHNEIKEHWSKVRKGRRFSSKLSKEVVLEIRKIYDSKPYYEKVGSIGRNGKIISYDSIFCKSLAPKYNISSANIYRIIKRETWQDV